MIDPAHNAVEPMSAAGRPARTRQLSARLAWLLFAALLIVIGGVLALGGGRLVWLGGSPYFVVSGLLTLASGLLLVIRRRSAAAVYAVMLILTIAWAIAESGFNIWALPPRILPPIVLGLPFLFWRPHRGRRAVDRARSSPGRGLIATAILAVIAVPVGYIVNRLAVSPVPDPAYQTGTGPADTANALVEGMPGRDWRYYGGDAGSRKYSNLTQITPGNVKKLQVAWTYRTGPTPKGLGSPAALEVTPIKVGDLLYVCTGYNDVIALDPDTGKERWRYRSGVDTRDVPVAACRGVTYAKVEGGQCTGRIFTNTVDARLIALDAATGRKCEDFGVDGEVSLLQGMGPVSAGYYYQTSAPTIVSGNIVIGGWVFDNQFHGEPSGVIRAFDMRTGELAWAWDMGRKGKNGRASDGEAYTLGTPNSWAPMVADEKLGLVYAPLGNPPPDHFGGLRRPFDEKFGSSIVALDGRTGDVRWSFQTVHHDLWDYDLVAPSLVDVPVGGADVPALLQPTKRGQLFLLDRRNGKPLAQVSERAVPQDGIVEGERLSATQPFSVGLPAFGGPQLAERSMWGLTALDQLWCRIHFREARYQGEFTPPGLSPFLIYPGYMGGSNWGGVAIDPQRNVAIVGSLHLATFGRLIPDEERRDRKIEPLVWSQVGKPGGGHPALGAQKGTPVAVNLEPFLSPLGIPCQQPPYGTLSAVNLRTRKLVWSIPLGDADESGPWGLKSGLSVPIGAPLQGGALTTASGLTFIGASQDKRFRAIETATGEVLWDTTLPVGGHASPSTFLTRSGKQIVVIAAGGSMPLRSGTGDYIVAYRLP